MSRTSVDSVVCSKSPTPPRATPARRMQGAGAAREAKKRHGGRQMSNADFGVPLQEFAYEGHADSLSCVCVGPCPPL